LDLLKNFTKVYQDKSLQRYPQGLLEASLKLVTSAKADTNCGSDLPITQPPLGTSGNDGQDEIRFSFRPLYARFRTHPWPTPG